MTLQELHPFHLCYVLACAVQCASHLEPCPLKNQASLQCSTPPAFNRSLASHSMNSPPSPNPVPQYERLQEPPNIQEIFVKRSQELALVIISESLLMKDKQQDLLFKLSDILPYKQSHSCVCFPNYNESLNKQPWNFPVQKSTQKSCKSIIWKLKKTSYIGFVTESARVSVVKVSLVKKASTGLLHLSRK